MSEPVESRAQAIPGTEDPVVVDVLGAEDPAMTDILGADDSETVEPVDAENPMTVDALGVWDAYFGTPVPGGVNWDAYSHEELYQMLWQDADVADVSTIAAEWAAHREALVNHAEVLREQRAALLASWEGSGAEEAARRLDSLAKRVEEIAELASAGELAAARAADALAAARAAMPPPPSSPVALAADTGTEASVSSSSGAPSGSESSGTPVALGGAGEPSAGADVLAAQGGSELEFSVPPSAPSTPSTSETTSDPVLGVAFSGVYLADVSLYDEADAADLSKQEAIRVMQAYEATLTDSSQMLGQAQNVAQSAQATTPSTLSTTTLPSGMSGASGETTGGTPSWQSLVGSGGGGSPSKGLAAGAAAGLGAFAGGVGLTTGAGGTGGTGGVNPVRNLLAKGIRVGALTMPGGSTTSAAQLATESATARSAGMGGMAPPGAGTRGKAEDEEHENRMPTIDHRLFPVAKPDSEVVIGLPPEEDL